MQVSIENIEALLPQNQCKECGYPGCRAYAEALTTGQAETNLCSHGGKRIAALLAKTLNRPFKTPALIQPLPGTAFIHEIDCIGCTRCIQACPADAIIGAAKLMHTIVKDWCTGCKLCVPACPTECIEMKELEEIPDDWRAENPSATTLNWIKNRATCARIRFDTLNQRKALLSNKTASSAPISDTSDSMSMPESAILAIDPKKAAIQAAMERARLMRGKNKV